MAYTVFTATGQLPLDGSFTTEHYKTFFDDFTQGQIWPLVFTFVFMVFNHLILAFDIRKGIERVANKLMPLLFLIILIMIARALTLEGAMEGVRFYLEPDFSKIQFSSLLLALGQTFFSLSVGFGVLITLSSYLDKKTSLLNSAAWIVGLDTLVAILSGLIIFPSIFAFGLDPAAGTSLIFQVLPIVFSKMFLGQLFALLFFSILVIAALTTSLTIFEVLITILVEKMNLSRKKASRTVLSVVFILGCIPSALSSSTFKQIRLLNKDIFEFYDYFSGNILFVLTAFFMTIFVGWVIPKDALKELQSSEKNPNSFWVRYWFFLIRYIIPIIIFIIFIKGLNDNLA
jgi:NSS family neurotransmitter:Na+ symporter